MEIKYEPVFGDQELFKGAPEYIEFIRFNDYSRELLWGDSNSINHLTFKDLKALPIVAMRRIIKEPKQWTWEDKKAGRLPEVGCRIYVPVMLEEQTVIYSSEKVIVSISDNGGAVTRTEVGSINRIKPIETPEEKASRLREEWCSNALNSASILSGMREYDLKRLGGYIGNIYDALLSGELTTPKGVSDEAKL